MNEFYLKSKDKTTCYHLFHPSVLPASLLPVPSPFRPLVALRCVEEGGERVTVYNNGKLDLSSFNPRHAENMQEQAPPVFRTLFFLYTLDVYHSLVLSLIIVKYRIYIEDDELQGRVASREAEQKSRRRQRAVCPQMKSPSPFVVLVGGNVAKPVM